VTSSCSPPYMVKRASGPRDSSDASLQSLIIHIYYSAQPEPFIPVLTLKTHSTIPRNELRLSWKVDKCPKKRPH